MATFLPADYGYVVAVIAAFGPFGLWQGSVVGKARKAAGIPYPCAYASKELADKDPKAKIFNCAQRAHANTIENLPWILAVTIVTGLAYPRRVAAFTALWMLGRVGYTLGYATGDPKKRNRGAIAYVGTLGLIVTSATMAYQMIASTF